MCIRDRGIQRVPKFLIQRVGCGGNGLGKEVGRAGAEEVEACLLYTSDAADERSSVDLGGRRIIKKKKGAGDERSCSIIEDKSECEGLGRIA